MGTCSHSVCEKRWRGHTPAGNVTAKHFRDETDCRSGGLNKLLRSDSIVSPTNDCLFDSRSNGNVMAFSLKKGRDDTNFFRSFSIQSRHLILTLRYVNEVSYV